MAAHNELGKWGENLAAEYLQDKGYEILERDWKSGHHDLDIVAKEDDTLVVVEVNRANTVRFDIISIVGTIGSKPEIDHIIDVALI